MNGEVMPLQGHLKDLRKVFIVSGLSLLAGSFIIFLAWGDWLFQFLTAPVRNLAVPVISIRVTEIFMTKMKISLLAGFVVSFPVMIFQIWSFVWPALTKAERRMIAVLAPLSVTLFAAGLSFAYFTVFPAAVRFLLLMAGDGLKPMITVGEYLSFTVAFFIPFGLAFEMPLAVYVLGKLGIIRPAALSRNRKYALLLVMVAAAVLTPGPDVVSQLMMAVPVYLLYELSIWVSYLVWRKEKREMEKETAVGLP
ncbi:MAG: twin-arginine translocase subunit TatC [Peptococcaceae bacterium]|nr:twin-arginine translocase subunit TatC [Peptococcaceae bacterium]